MVKEILSNLEQFETVIDGYLQVLKKNNDDIYQNLSEIWKNMQAAQKEDEELTKTIAEQNSELTELRGEEEGLDKTIEGHKEKKGGLNSKVTELKNTLETTLNDLKKPQFELEDIISKLENANNKITAKDSEKTQLDQKKIDNENREESLNFEFSKKIDELDKKIETLKQENFFSTFLIENSDEDMPEVDIIAAIMEKETSNLDELKKMLDVPPIMAVRTIKQLAVKGIIKLDERSGKVSMP